MDDALDKIYSLTTAAFVAVAMNAVALFKYWGPIMQRRNERLRDIAAEKSSDWTRLRDLISSLTDEVTRLGKRLESVENENEECRKNLSNVRDELAVERAERIKFERLLQGEGEIRQAAQNAVSELRLEKKD